MSARWLAVLSCFPLFACSDTTIIDHGEDPPPVVSPGEITGRICDASGVSWLQDAKVYTHIKSGDTIIDTQVVYTDPDGRFLLDDLPGEADYDIFVQDGADRLWNQESYGVWVADGERVQLDEPDCFDPVALNIAIVTGEFDDFDHVLEGMGFRDNYIVDGTNLTELRGFLSDVDNLQPFDVIFFNGGHLEEGVVYPEAEDDGDAGIDGHSHEPTEDPSVDIMANLREYVADGGVIYASDWAYDVVEQGWPDRVDFVGDDDTPDAAQLGEYDVVNAVVSDDSMAQALDQDYLEITYDLPVWAPVESADGAVSVHLQGNIAYRQGTATYTLATSPLLLSFSEGHGSVVYSTFRVAQNSSAEQLQVLQYLIYGLIEQD